MINEIICGDSLKLMTLMAESSVDLIVTSPPYNARKSYDVYQDNLSWDQYHNWLRESCRSMYRVIKPNSCIFINICDLGISNRDAEHKIGNRGNFHVIPNHIVVIDEMTKLGAQYLHPIFWQKISNHKSQFGGPAKFCGTYPYGGNCHVPSETEYILRFRKNGKYKKVPKEIKELSRVSKERWLELSSQIWNFGGKSDKGHPATFPLELPLRCIEGWSIYGSIVFDPFIGIGTTAIAAISLGRQYIGFELSEKYCNIANDRIDCLKRDMGLIFS